MPLIDKSNAGIDKNYGLIVGVLIPVGCFGNVLAVRKKTPLKAGFI